MPIAHFSGHPPPGPVRWLLVALLLVLTLATYSNSFSGIIEGDASALVHSDARIHSFTPENLRLIGSRTYWSSITSSTVFRPLVTLSWMMNYVWFGNGERAFGYHVFNLTLHLINVILAWLLLLQILGDALPAFWAAAIFAVHPVNTEAVTNIAGRADLMATTGVLAGLLLFVHIHGWNGWRRNTALAGLLLASAFGFLSKENAVVLPAAMLLYDLLFSRRENRAIGPYVAALTPILGIMAWRRWMLPGLMDNVVVVDNPLAAASFWKARLTAFEVLWRYMGLLAWPKQLSWDYSYNQIPLATTAGGLFALAGLLVVFGVLVSLYRRAAPVCFFGIFFFLALAPTSNVPFLIGAIMAERFLYLSSIGFAVCVVVVVLANCQRASKHSTLASASIFLLVLVALGVRTWNRNAEWTDGAKLWESGVAVSPNSFKTHLSRINVYYRQGLDLNSLEECIEEAKKAVAILADLPPEQSTAKPLATLGSLYLLKGDTLMRQQMASPALGSPLVSGTVESPAQWYERALQTLSEAATVDRIQSAAERQWQLKQGVPQNRIREGGSGFLYAHLADNYRRLARFPEALEAFRHLSAIAPTDAAVYRQIAQVEQAMGSTGDEITALWQAQALESSELTENELIAAYREFDPRGCAVADGKLIRDCSSVKANNCRAQLDLASHVAESGLPEESMRLRQAADRLGCGM
jgi:protein O-mannosyl-transferase